MHHFDIISYPLYVRYIQEFNLKSINYKIEILSRDVYESVNKFYYREEMFVEVSNVLGVAQKEYLSFPFYIERNHIDVASRLIQSARKGLIKELTTQELFFQSFFMLGHEFTFDEKGNINGVML